MSVEQTTSSLDFFTKKENKKIAAAFDEICLDHLKSEVVTTPKEMEELQALFPFRVIPEEGIGETSYLSQLKEEVLPHSINTGSPYYMGHMTSLLPNFVRPLSKVISTLNQNLVKVETAKALTAYEKQALAMLHNEVYGNNDAFYMEYTHHDTCPLGIIASGGTIANLTALQCARNISLHEFGDVEKEGLFPVLQKAGYKKSVIITSQLGHYSIQKNLGLLGLGTDNLISIPTDENQKMDIVQLEQTISECEKNKIHITAIVAIAGTTECGSFDPLSTIADIAKNHKIHFHVDAAWGGALLFSSTYKHLLEGIELADSVTIDGHKQLYLPMGMGIVLFKNPQIPKVISNTANYIIRKDSQDLGKTAIEGSRSAHVIYLQASLQLMGKSGYGEVLDKNIKTAKNVSELIGQEEEFELLTHPQSNIFLYRYIPQKYRNVKALSESENLDISNFNIRLQEDQKEKGHTFVSRTLFQLDNGETVTALRIVLANPLTEVKHCREMLNEQVSIALGFE